MTAGQAARVRFGHAATILIALAGMTSLVVQWYRTRPLWLDEEMIALNFRDRRVAELPGLLWMNQSAPLGWLALQRIVLVEFGSTERALRALPVAFGIAGIALAAVVGRRWMSPVGAAIFVALVSFGEFVSYFPLEIKQYSADVFFGLLLPSLALWALSLRPGGSGTSTSRTLVWWIVASAAQWFSVGALLTTPACALVLCGTTWRREGWRRGLLAAVPGVCLLVSFGAHYRLSLSAAVHSEELQSYWMSGYPPPGAGGIATLRWLGQQAERLARNPAGSHWWTALWFSAACGIALTLQTDPTRGWLLAALPLSGFAFTAMRLVPLTDRLALWMIPSVYAAIAAAVDGGATVAQRALKARWWSSVLLAVAIAGSGLLVTADIVRSGIFELSIQPRSKHGFDDRAALRYLTAMLQPGDAIVSVKLGLPAVWWYAGISVAEPNSGRTFRGSPILEARERSGDDCRAENLPASLEGRNRAAVYLGFGSEAHPGFQELVLDTLSLRGKMVAYRRVAEQGIVAMFDLREQPTPWPMIAASAGGPPLKDVARPDGCVGFFPAGRW